MWAAWWDSSGPALHAVLNLCLSIHDAPKSTPQTLESIIDICKCWLLSTFFFFTWIFFLSFWLQTQMFILTALIPVKAFKFNVQRRILWCIGGPLINTRIQILTWIMHFDMPYKAWLIRKINKNTWAGCEKCLFRWFISLIFCGNTSVLLIEIRNSDSN